MNKIKVIPAKDYESEVISRGSSAQFIQIEFKKKIGLFKYKHESFNGLLNLLTSDIIIPDYLAEKIIQDFTN